MRKLACSRIVKLLGMLVVSAVVHAQVVDSSPTSALPPADVQDALSTAGAAPEQAITRDAGETVPEVHPEYATALDGSGFIRLDSEASRHLILGGAVSAGWDSNPNNQGNGASTALYTVAPYIGLRAVTSKVRALTQYQFTNTSFASAYVRQSMHLGSIHLERARSERWSWGLDAAARYGEDALRFLGSPQTVAVGEVPGTGPNAASYLPDAGKVTYVEDAFSITYLKSQRDTIAISVGDVFSRYQRYAGSNSIATTNVSYQHDLTPTLKVLGYQQNSFYYGTLSCQSYGAGVGMRWRPRERTTLSLSGGPQLDTASCGSQQGFAYNSALNSRLTGRSQLYLLAARQPTGSYLGPGVWQQSVSGGYQRQVRSKGEVSFDAGYVASSTLVRLTSYRGTYVDCVYSYAFGHGLRATSSYRGYVGDSGSLPFHRNVAQYSIAWTPSAGHLFQ